MRKMEYTILVEKTSNGFSAHSPDLPGCVAAGDTEDETIALMKEAMEFHIQGLKKDGDPVPRSSTKAVIFQLTI